MTPGQRLTMAAGNVRVALRQRDQAIRDMRAEGATLRQIATTAGLTAGGVKKILDRGNHTADSVRQTITVPIGWFGVDGELHYLTATGKVDMPPGYTFVTADDPEDADVYEDPQPT